MDLKVEKNLNHQNDIKNEFHNPSNSKNHVLNGIVGQAIDNIILKMADGSHFGFGPLTELAHTLAMGRVSKIFN